jgi:hypothetical protein
MHGQERSVERRLAMSSLKASVKHARYMMGSLSAVLFAVSAGGNF